MLTFESNDDSEQVEVHGDKEGLLMLAKILTDMAEKGESGSRNLMTKDWGGGELSNDKQRLDNTLWHHVKIFFWNT
tara:strand:- start:2025 stop:2252 length:228 start_codon:yes stop_codon:yes gene_type:complete